MLQVIAIIFIIESLLKIIAYGKQYFLQISNWFDLFIILLSIVDLSVPSINGLSVFRTFRLVDNLFKNFCFILIFYFKQIRIFKLAKTWKTMRKILLIIGHSVAALSYLSLVLFIVIYVLALIGLDLFSTSYANFYSEEEMPRYINFKHIDMV